MKRLSVVLVAIALMACSSEQPAATNTSASAEQKTAAAPPSAAQAREIIAKSGELGQHEFTNAAVSLPVAGSSMNEPTRALAKQLAAAGWIALDGAGDIMLTDKSRSDKRFLLRENGLLDVVPLAKKEMGDVTAVRSNPDGTVNADFTWRWIANEVGTAFTSGPVHDRFNATHNATANLMWNGTEWTIILVEGR
ncbi:MAG TPA: hypothetical protein VFV49_00280 [Thermoanaerobaculia bacterium]|nr:hypothetical protein [Thermoanaerobaculia bacterium]